MHLLQHFKPSEVDFVKRISSNFNDVINNKKSYLYNFLNPREQEIVKIIVGKNNDVNLLFFGGYEEAEFKRCFISLFDCSSYKITCFKIKYSNKFKPISHRSILGTLMSLGIKREVFGDIIEDSNGEFYFYVTEEISGFIKSNFFKIGNTPIELKETTETLEIKVTGLNKTVFINSFRVDLIISAAFNLSRKKASSLVECGYVRINHQECKNSSQKCGEYDIISVRSKGKLKLLGIDGKSKTGNFVLKVNIKQ